MNPKYQYTIRWKQPYSTEHVNPYLRQLHDAIERAIEAQIQYNHCPEAKEVIARIMAL